VALPGHFLFGAHRMNEQTLSRECQGARTLAVALMAQHGLSGWSFGFNKNVRRTGVCIYPTRTQPGRIELSIHLIAMNSDEDIRDTILHEIAHALTGAEHNHDEVWKAKCREIGARPERCYGEEIEMPKGRWVAECGSCQKKYYRHRRPRHLVGWHCKFCGTERGKLVWCDGRANAVNPRP